MINNPIALSLEYSDNFKIIFNELMPPNDCNCLLLHDKIIKATDLDWPSNRFIIRDKYNKPCFKLLNKIKFTTNSKYFKLLKGFQVNNSSWVNVKLSIVEPYCFGKIYFSTPLDMMGVCNELFVNNLHDGLVCFICYPT